MLSKNKIKLIKSLSQKKYRLKEELFLAEGNKLVLEVLNSGYRIQTLIATSDFIESVKTDTSEIEEIIPATRDEIKKASLLKTPQESIVLCKIPEYKFTFREISDKLILCLDTIQDPGNMGTILRIADWFGIHNICASVKSTDIFNPKAIQASMGAFLRVKVFYTDLEKLISEANEANVPTYGTFMSGKNIYSENLPENGLIIMGNEGRGISENLESIIKNKIHIPGYQSVNGEGSESLNVSVATSIICSEFRRNILKNVIQNGNKV